MREKIPVSVVTGFLGAGKTTLLRHLLREAADTRFVVIENEFGSTGIDGSLVSELGTPVYELNDGCVCCTIREDLVEVCQTIANLPDPPQHLLIETTGLAQPAPVLRVFDQKGIREVFQLDGIITVVDAAHIHRSLEDGDACAEQITYADRVVLNKMDTVSESRLAQAKERVRQLNPLARILPTIHGEISPRELLRLGRTELFPSSVGTSNLTDDQGSHHHHHDHDHEHQHDADIHSFSVEADGNVNLEKLDLWLGQLVRSRDLDMLRMKGIIAVPEDSRRFIFNGVRAALDVRPGESWSEREERMCQIVFIGRHLDFSSLQGGLERCMLR